jgi:hypothetical protein
LAVLLNETSRELTTTIDATAAHAELIAATGERHPLEVTDGKWKLSLPPWGLAVIESDFPPTTKTQP